MTDKENRRFHLMITALLLMVTLTSCGIYAVRFDPPRGNAVVSRHGPLDLSMSLGEVAVIMNGKVLPLTTEIIKQYDDSFIRRAQSSRLVTAVYPRGTKTDLYYDELGYVDTGGYPSVGRSLYRIIAFVPALVIPGVPYPWQFHIRRQARIRGEIGNVMTVLREYTVDYRMNVWTGTVWGLVGSIDQLEAPEGDYLIDSLARAIEGDYDTFKQFEIAARRAQPQIDGTTAKSGVPSLDAAVVRIRSGRSVGSGFFVTADLIATNAHVVHGSPEVGISFSRGKEYRGPIAYEDTQLDFALVRSSVQSTPLPLRHTPLSDGENVLSVGFPQGRYVVAASTGTVRKIIECCVEHDALVAGGSSGGPLLDLNSNVIGINTARVKAKGDRKNQTDRTWALKMSYILESIPQAGEGK